ncbi:MAG: DoxX family membrane protein [Phycisphaerales bacterium]|nr:DoxX family membrane protein [Phycisphaerales bacterium]
MSRIVMAVLVSPVFLRLLLAVTFIWAGLGKVMQKMEFSGDDARRLAEWGVVAAPATDARPSTDPPATAPAKDATTPPSDSTPGDPAAPAAEPNPADAPAASTPPATADAKVEPAVGPVKVYPLYGIALAIDHAATPGPNPDGSPGMALVPAKAADGKTPIILAWAATITELAAGVFVLIGFLTRLSAFSLACVMAVAMWLTQIGPAIASGAAKLGFLPNLPSAFDPGYQTLLLQFILLCASLSLMFAGAGMLSLDRLLFHRSPTVVTRPVAVTPAA